MTAWGFKVRSGYGGALRLENVEQRVVLCGWMHRRRDHGGVIFVDLRDRAGVVQLVFHPQESCFPQAEKLRSEYVLQVGGVVRARSKETVNPHMATGAIEVWVDELQLLNQAQPPPFPLDEHADVGEETRLRYRYIDLRRPEMAARLRARAQCSARIRRFLEARGFLEIETPLLTRTTPEGARDYLVPSRLHAGSYFALPQSPQLFKQLLMMSGLERYFQLARCFRDEDLRADRQPEFTQIDLEASFVSEQEVMELSEALLHDVFRAVWDIELPAFARLGYQEALSRYGSDQPDLRVPLELVDIADLMAGVPFRVFAAPAADPEGRVVALRVPGGASLSRAVVDAYTEFVSSYGAAGLAWIKVEDVAAGVAGLRSPIVKHIPPEVVAQTLERVAAESGDLIFFGAGNAATVSEYMGRLRTRLGDDLELRSTPWAPLWVVDFPMFKRDQEGNPQAMHHPFTRPHCGLEELRAQPFEALSHAYDVVLNGVELGGGSLRIHDAEQQAAVFELLGMTRAAAQQQFGFFLEALRYGCPPHGGVALGLDRVVMLAGAADSIRDVVAFPKTQSTACLLTQAPGEVDAQQLAELGQVPPKRGKERR